MSEIALKLIREAKENRATRLDLGNCGLTELPEALFELTWLEELILSSSWNEYSFEKMNWESFESLNKGKANHIKFIDSNIKTLKQLNKLIASGKWDNRWELNDLSPLKTLTTLQHINIDKTKISDLSPLKGLTALQTLSMNSTRVRGLNSLKNLTALQLLSIDSTRVSDLNPLEKLTQLQFLDVSRTQVEDLTTISKLFKNPKFKFNYTNSPITTPPKEILDLGNSSVINYFNQIIFSEEQLDVVLQSLEIKISSLKKSQINSSYLNEKQDINEEIRKHENLFNKIKIARDEQKKNGTGVIFEIKKNQSESSIFIELGKVELYEAKLIIVGEGATGKTTLFEKLKDNNFQLTDTDETHGINIHEGLAFHHPLIGENVFNANLWDFGGQELQYMTHQFFLTPRALYVLMMDARKESPNLAYWFKIISLLGRDNQDSTEKVRLLLVFNKRGNTTGTPPQYQDQLSYYADSLDVQYLEVDFADNDYRFDALQKAIQQSLVTLPIVKSQLPRLWKVVRDDLREEARQQNYITTDRFSAMCSKHGITEEADQWLLSGYLHQLGSLLHFQNDNALMQFVILSPQWATDGVYTFLSAERISNNKGRFTKTDFYDLLAAKDYKRNDAGLVLQLMTKNNFDICYEATEGHYVAAQLLPDNAPVYPWVARDVLQFRYQYPIMPKGLMSRLIVRLSDDIERDGATNEQVVWKKGVVLFIQLKEGHCRVRLREDDAESKSGLRQILIDVMGDKEARKYALRRVRDTVEDLHKRWFRSIKPDEMVPCCCSECVSNTVNPQLYKLENLLKLRSKGANIPLRCYDSAEEVFTQQLLEGVYDKMEIREMENQGKY